MSLSVFNAGAAEPARNPGAVAEQLADLMSGLKSAAFRAGQVDYRALEASASYVAYRQWTLQLPRCDPSRLPAEQKLAFWINLYNALTIDAVIRFAVRGSVHEVRGFRRRSAYLINAERYSPDDIEHGVLRANRGHPAIPGPRFFPGDSRRRQSLAILDPRVHFAIVCAARSCPPISAYRGSLLVQQLQTAARSFMAGGGGEVSGDPPVLHLSRIFLWYANDFGAAPFALWRRAALVATIRPYLSAQQQAAADAAGTRIRFVPYDWSLNTA